MIIGTPKIRKTMMKRRLGEPRGDLEAGASSYAAGRMELFTRTLAAGGTLHLCEIGYYCTNGR